jgi:hypothetical protein
MNSEMNEQTETEIETETETLSDYVKTNKAHYIRYLFKGFTEKSQVYLIDIDTINGIKVDVYCQKSYDNNLLFKVSSNSICINGDSWLLYTSKIITINGDKSISDFQEAFEKGLTLLETLTFDKISTRFVTEPIIHLSSLYPDLFKSGNICHYLKECSVCYELTKQKTPCNHMLCFPCWSKIKIIIKDDDSYDYERPCPICRTDISVAESDDDC